MPSLNTTEQPSPTESHFNSLEGGENESPEKFEDRTPEQQVAKRYRCEFCSKSFDGRRSFNAHTLIHTSDKPHQCKLCNKSFAERKRFNAHMSQHRRKERYQCKLCDDESFADKRKFRIHRLRHVFKKTYQCEKCEKILQCQESIGNAQEYGTSMQICTFII